MLSLQLVFIMLCSASAVTSKSVAEIEWSTANPLFGTGESTVYVRMMDSIEILCPRSSKESLAVYVVDSREQAEKCLVRPDVNKLILECFPDTLPPSKSTTRFRPFSPTPGAPEFRENQDYFFMSTSSGDISGLKNTVGGVCKTHNMRIRFHVLPRMAQLPKNPIFPAYSPEILKNEVSTPVLKEKLPDLSRRDSMKTNQLYDYLSDPAQKENDDDAHVIEFDISPRDWIVGYEPELLNSGLSLINYCYFTVLCTCLLLDILLVRYI